MASRILAGRYEILERIGDGGMAVVFKARCRLLNRFVAIKILKPEYINDAKFIESFRRESQAAASLSHPNIVSIYDVGKEGNIYYIVMELLEAYSLGDVIKKEAPIEPRRAAAISKQIAAGLSSAHKNGIIHRDIKPHNILMTKDGTPKITDFGIAKAMNSGTIVTNTSTVMGSVHYLSPEQAKGGYVDDKSDIYSLGIVMYEMLTGKVPFDGENAVSVAMMHMNNDVPAPSLSEPDVPYSLDEIVLKATSRHPSDRYQSAQEMYNALVRASFEISSGMNAAVAMGVPGAREAKAGKGEKQQPAPEKSTGTGTKDITKADVPPHPPEDKPADVAGSEEFLEAVEAGVPEEEAVAAVSGRNNSTKKRKKSKNGKTSVKVKILAIFLAFVCALLASFGIINAMSAMKGNPVTVPDLRGYTVEEAIDVLSGMNLDYKLGSEIYSNQYSVGRVASQKPEMGETVKEGYKITLNVSKGAEGSGAENLVEVPNVVGKDLSDAKSILKSYGLKVELNYIKSDYPKDTVISQTPETGNQVAKDTKIALTISEGNPDENTEMPDLVGKDADTARTLIEEAGLVLGNVATAYSSDYAENTVMEQDYPAGSKLVKGAEVAIKVSLGPEAAPVEPVETETQVYNEVPFTISYSDAPNEVFNMTVTVTDEAGLRVVVNNEQRLKSNGSETLYLQGTGKGTVRVTFDDTLISETEVDFGNAAG